jgi:hypothetical protein
MLSVHDLGDVDCVVVIGVEAKAALKAFCGATVHLWQGVKSRDEDLVRLNESAHCFVG